MVKNISKKIFDKIKKEHMAPVPAWHYVLPNVLKWGSVVLVLGIAAMAIAVIFWELQIADFDMENDIKQGFWDGLYLHLPYFWMVLLAIFVVLAFFVYRHTKFGYRHGLSVIGLVIFGCIGVLGCLLWKVEASEPIEDVFRENLPIYKQIETERLLKWEDPEGGSLGGTITKLNGRSELLLLDAYGDQWAVDLNGVGKARVDILKAGMSVKITGQITSDDKFKASKVGFWKKNIKAPKKVKETK